MRRALASAAMALCFGGTAAAQDVAADDRFLEEWSIFGDVLTRAEHYDNFGDAASSPFPDTGFQFSTEAFVDFRRRRSAFETIGGDVGVLVNRSDYRSDEENFVLERARLEWEKGDVATPFRAVAGDYFAFFSPRTVQTSVKGAQVEFQPNIGGPETLHSIVAFVGVDAPAYRDLEDDTDMHAGLSWFTNFDDLSVAANLAGNWQERSDGQDNIGNGVASFAFEAPFDMGDGRVTVEGEVGGFQGETGQADGQKTDVGLFLETRGRHAENRLTWSLMFERYGQDYAPGGATINSDRSTAEARAGWRFESGLRLTGRLQRFEDALESGNPTVTELAGLSLTGPFWRDRLVSGSFDVFARSAEDDNGLRDQDSLVSRLNLTTPIDEDWTGRAGGFFSLVDDKVADDLFETYEASLGADRRFRLGELSGFYGPEAVARRIVGGALDAVEFGPRLTAGLFGDGHSANLSYALTATLDDGNEDLLRQNVGLRYAYTEGPHRFGFDADYIARDPGVSERTDSYRVGVFYAFSFNRPAGGGGQAVAAASPAAGLDLAALAPGMPAGDALDLVVLNDFVLGAAEGGALVFDGVYLEGFDERQRLALVDRDDELELAAVIIDLDDTGRPDRLENTFDRVRAALIRRYGPPTASVAEGDFSEDLANDLANGRFVRTDEWRTESGRLRFGIPRRIDRVVRLELQHAERFPPPQDAAWSLEFVR